MSDFDDFETNGNDEKQPHNDTLNQPDDDLDSFVDQVSAPAQSQNDSDPFNDADATHTNNNTNQYNDLHSPSLDQPDGDDDQTQARDDFEGFTTGSAQNADLDDLDGVNESKQQPIEEEETEYQKWEKQRTVELQQRQDNEKKQKQELLQQAQAEITKFHDDFNKTLVKQQKFNRSEEAQLKEELQALMKNGTVWEKVARMTNLSARTVEKGQQPRVERMRKLLIQLKSQQSKDGKLQQSDSAKPTQQTTKSRK